MLALIAQALLSYYSSSSEQGQCGCRYFQLEGGNHGVFCSSSDLGMNLDLQVLSLANELVRLYYIT